MQAKCRLGIVRGGQGSGDAVYVALNTCSVSQRGGGGCQKGGDGVYPPCISRSASRRGDGGRQDGGDGVYLPCISRSASPRGDGGCQEGGDGGIPAPRLAFGIAKGRWWAPGRWRQGIPTPCLALLPLIIILGAQRVWVLTHALTH